VQVETETQGTATQTPTPPHNCPFYGRHMRTLMPGADTTLASLPIDPPVILPPFILIDQRGNGCALIHRAYYPCQEEIAKRPVDWQTCHLIQQDVMTDAL
jgi:hypothetical protein